VSVAVHDLAAVLWFFVPAYLANMSPVFVQGRFERLAAPIDGGRTFRGRRILGDHKTWRGIVAGIGAGVVVAGLQRLIHGAGWCTALALVDYSASWLAIGFLLGLGTGVGDAVKSFFKRQIGIAPGRPWIGFDQLDFMVGAYAFVSLVYVPPLAPTLLALPIVFAGSIGTTATGYGLGLKETWI
jgi:CDP-2,3-bis-(O-geranylgeranyl)-sn-glycerol synthase